MPDDTLLLPTKLHPPARQAGSLLRARLVDALMERSSHKLQLLIAPAGYGKTTLLTDFATDAPFPLAWLTLDPADRDPHSFIEYLVAALRTQFPECGGSTLRALAGTPDIAARSAALARTLAADVYANVPALCLLVLDDFQEVNDSAVVTGFLDELLRLLPENLRLLISSRTYPNLNVFSRLAVEQQLTGLGEADLRFTGEEVRALFQSRYEKELTGKQAEELADRSEGWIAGLLLSAHGVWDGLLERVIETRGEGGPVYDYLADAAYTRQPQGLRAFLLASSVTRTVDVAICEALLGPGRWLDSLEEAERANLFLSRLPGSPPSFRYHQLFREFLQSRLHREQPEEYRRLHMAAADLMAARSDWPLALEHFQEAGAHAESAELISRIAPQLEREGRWYLLARSIDALPEEVRLSQPTLLISRARAAILTVDLKTAVSSAERALERLTPSSDRPTRARALHVLGSALRFSGRTEEAMVALKQALLTDPESPALRAEVDSDLGICWGMQGDFARAVEHLSMALAWFEEHELARQAARTEASLGTAYSRMGRVDDAASFFQRALDRWRRANEDTDEVPIVLNNLGNLRYMQGHSDAARRLLEEGLTAARTNGNRRGEAALEGTLGMLLLTSGVADEAEGYYTRALSIGEELGDLWAITLACEGLGLCASLTGAAASASSWFDRASSLAERQRSSHLVAQLQLDRALLDLRCGEVGHGLELLDSAEPVFRTGNATRDLIRLGVTRAILLGQVGDHAEAAQSFQRTLGLSATLGLCGLVDLPATFEPRAFAAIEAGEFAVLRDDVLTRIRSRPAVEPVPEKQAAPEPGCRLAVRAFGRGEAILSAGAPVDWGREKARELFFYLLFEGPIRASRIIDDLWPETSAARGRAGFDSAAYALRRRLHADVLLTARHQYMISPEVVATHDAGEFDAKLEHAEQADTPERQLAHLEAAIEVYSAPLLNEMSGQWVEVLREKYERRAVNALATIATIEANRGNWRASLVAAEKALAIQLNEDLFAAAVRASVRLSDAGSAARLLRQWRRRMPDMTGPNGALFQMLARETARLSHSPT